jgi:hypothetical protein
MANTAGGRELEAWVPTQGEITFVTQNFYLTMFSADQSGRFAQAMGRTNLNASLAEIMRSAKSPVEFDRKAQEFVKMELAHFDKITAELGKRIKDARLPEGDRAIDYVMGKLAGGKPLLSAIMPEDIEIEMGQLEWTYEADPETFYSSLPDERPRPTIQLQPAPNPWSDNASSNETKTPAPTLESRSGNAPKAPGDVQSTQPKQMSAAKSAEVRMSDLLDGKYNELRKTLTRLRKPEFEKALMQERAALLSLISDCGEVPPGVDIATVLSNAFVYVGVISDFRRQEYTEVVRGALAKVDIEELARKFMKDTVLGEQDQKKLIGSLRGKETQLGSLPSPERIEQEIRMTLLRLDELVSSGGVYATVAENLVGAESVDKFRGLADKHGKLLLKLASDSAWLLGGVEQATLEQDIADWYARLCANMHNEPIQTERQYAQIILDAMRSNH